jgi:TonB family protein
VRLGFVCLIVLLSITAERPASATEIELAASERIVLTQQALSGDLEALERLEADDPERRWGLLVRGYALQAAGRFDEAVAAWERSAELGLRLAARALAAHHYERRNWMEAYAWARLVMEVEASLTDGDLDELRGGWALYTAVHAAEGLDEDQHRAADALAAERVKQHLAAMISPDDVGSQSEDPPLDLDVVRRTRPNYPLSLAENGVPGWSYVQFEILPNGRVGETVAIGASHDRFAREAVRAIRKWRFNVDAMDELPATGFQQIDFTLQR